MPNPIAPELKAIEREYLDGVDVDDRESWRIARAVLMLVAEIRELREMLDVRLSEGNNR